MGGYRILYTVCNKAERKSSEMIEPTLPALSCKGLWKTYKSQTALANVTLTVPRGRIVGLLGPNGSGKTTLMKLAADLLTPTQGEILVAGHQPGTYTKSIVSYLPERPYFSPSMRVSACLSIFADFYADFDRVAASDMLARLGVSEQASFSALSKGTKEKVQLVLVMARRAVLYLLDEPIGGVDPAARDYILDTIISNYKADATVLISTHLVADVEKVLDDYVFLQNGRITACASVASVPETGCSSLDELFRRSFRC